LKKDSEEGKRIQTELKCQICNTKIEYKNNTELQFKWVNMRDAWKGIYKSKQISMSVVFVIKPTELINVMILLSF